MGDNSSGSDVEYYLFCCSLEYLVIILPVHDNLVLSTSLVAISTWGYWVEINI